MRRRLPLTLTTLPLLALLAAPSAAGAATCTITGTSRPDVLVGTAGPDVICGLGGDDDITALGGNDVIYAGPGWDTIRGGDGDDTIYLGPDSGQAFGEVGNDRISGSDNGGYGVFDGGPGDDVLTGLASGEAGRYEVDDNLRTDNYFETGDGNDRVYGSVNADFVGGNGGDKRIWGRAGNDVLTAAIGKVYGEAGNDVVIADQGEAYGGDGDDYVDSHDGVAGGGPGADLLVAPIIWAGDDADVDRLLGTGPTPQCHGRANDIYEGCGPAGSVA